MSNPIITDTSICNSALIKLGAERINSLSEDNKRARTCAEQYPKVRDALLRMHPWNFAVSRINLALISGYTPAYEFEKAFQLPLDCLRVLDTSLNYMPQIGEVKWAIETDANSGNKVLVTNESTVAIKYIRRVAETQFDVLFAEVLALKLAYDMAYAITQSTTVTQLLFQEFKDKLSEARSFDAQEGSVPQVEANDWFLGRL